MADTAARLAICARRNEVARFTIAVTGIDLTGVAMAMQIRLGRDVPGAPLISLPTVTTLAAEGLKLDGVTTINGVPTSVIKGRINASTMTDATKVPYTGEVGDNTVLAYAMQWTIGGDAQTRLYGDFIAVASAFGSDGAPTNRPASYGSPSASCGGANSGSLTFGDQVIAVTLAASDLTGLEVAKTAAAAATAVAARDGILNNAGFITVSTDLALGANSKISIVAGGIASVNSVAADLALGASGSYILRAPAAAVAAAASAAAAASDAAKLASVPAVVATGVDAEQLLDLRGQIVRRTDVAGEQYLPNMRGRSVQKAITDGENKTSEKPGQRTGDIFQIEDRVGNVTMRQDRRGAWYIPGSPTSVQAALGVQLKHTPKFPTSREKLHATIKPLMASLVAEGLPFVQPPAQLVPNNYVVPDSVVSAFRCTATTPRQLDTPYGLGGLVHPYLLEMRAPFMGYRYIMSETPHKYTSANEENPIFYGSNDLKQFDLLPEIHEPFGFPRSASALYNSDDALTYDPRTGELILIWRESITPGKVKLHFRSTWNGVDWSPETTADFTGEGWLSPAILFDPVANVWRMWVINTIGIVAHYTSDSLYKGWSVTGTPQTDWQLVGTDDIGSRYGIAVWHLEVKYIGSKFFLLANMKDQNSNLFLGVSADGTTWTMGPGLIQPQVPYVYKGTFIPQFSGNMMRLQVAWNFYFYPAPAGLNLAFHCESTNWVDMTTL